MFKDIKIKAFFMGFLVYIGLVLVTMGYGMFEFFSIVNEKGLDIKDPETSVYVQGIIKEDTSFMVIMLVISLIGYVLSGFTTAKVAKVAEMKNSIFLSIVVFIISLIFFVLGLVFSKEPTQWGLTLLSWLILFGGILLGGYLGTSSEPEQPAV